MSRNATYVIGLMSGTSLDGIDLVYVSFHNDNYKQFEIISSKTFPYSQIWKEKLQYAISQKGQDISILNDAYGVLLGEKINEFIKEFNIAQIDFIASHGHTIFHQPEKGYTLQIGNGQNIANVTGCKVICDFRTQDVKLGGQGAPLVPVGDQLLFGHYEYCLNLGGFANLSFEENGQRIAYDICAVNIVLNALAQKLGFAYDDSGNIARSGKYIMQLETDLRALEYYKQKPPKSLGLEWVQKEIFPKLFEKKRNLEDLLRTYTEHTAWALAKAFPKNAVILVTGGGVYNSYLIERIQFYKKIKMVIPNKEIIEFKEALIFALLGLLKDKDEINCLKSVTGASKNHSSGVVFKPNN